MKLPVKLVYISFLLILGCGSANKQETTKEIQLDPQFNDYWYDGAAEISSYKLEQARYGTIRNGYAINVFVTEHFSATKMVKSDNPDESSLPVMKLNHLRKFNTGVYDYSIMSSAFLNIATGQHLKTTTSSQEWCGQTFNQLTLKNDQFEHMGHSYFESEGEQNELLPNTYAEDQILNVIRTNPSALLTGEFEILPSMIYAQLMHVPVKAYKANGTLSHTNTLSNYEYHIPTLERTVTVSFERDFPYKILEWTETYVSGYGERKKELTTRASLIKMIKLDYWNKNQLKDTTLRTSLGIPD